ncbi:MAG: hypothetical protein QXN55_01255 [Candidatus Nitrosotenuis sp.]
MLDNLSTNPLLAKVKLPGRVFQLPSRGTMYNGSELAPNVVNGEIHVHPMSALDEIVIKNPDLLFNGSAIETVLKTCIPDILKPHDLFARDVDAVMLFLRLVTYGNNYELHRIHTCDDAKSHSYVVDLEQQIQTMEYLDPTVVTDQYTVQLDNDQHVVIQPVRYRHLLEIVKLNESKKEFSADDIQKTLMMNLLNIIKSVDGIEDKKMIRDWLKIIPAPFINKITTSVENTNAWGPKLEVMLECRDCGESFNAEIPINPVSFFTE